VHAEIKALQQQFGLSYKDSAHCLYMAEVKKVRAFDTAHKSFSEIWQRINTILDHELIPPLSSCVEASTFNSPWQEDLEQ